MEDIVNSRVKDVVIIVIYLRTGRNGSERKITYAITTDNDAIAN